LPFTNDAVAFFVVAFCTAWRLFSSNHLHANVFHIVAVPHLFNGVCLQIHIAIVILDQSYLFVTIGARCIGGTA
jgi:hypothetical protein